MYNYMMRYPMLCNAQFTIVNYSDFLLKNWFIQRIVTRWSRNHAISNQIQWLFSRELHHYMRIMNRAIWICNISLCLRSAQKTESNTAKVCLLLVYTQGTAGGITQETY